MTDHNPIGVDPSIQTRQQSDNLLSPESLLLEEFRFAADRTKQAEEARERSFTLYFTLIGGAASVIVALSQFSATSQFSAKPIATGLLLLIGILSPLFFVQLVRTRQAWSDGQIAMNVIKEYYISKCRKILPDFDSAFRWRIDGILSGNRPKTGSFVRTYPVALIGSLSLAIGAYLISEYLASVYTATSAGISDNWGLWAVAISIFLVTLVAYSVYYRVAINKRAERQTIEGLKGPIME